jgi:hypothetical protein
MVSTSLRLLRTRAGIAVADGTVQVPPRFSRDTATLGESQA